MMTQENDASGEKMLKVGLVGSLIAALCCFTPLLVVMFVGAGLGGLVGGLDYVLFPLLFGSLGLVAQALYIQSGRRGPSPKTAIVILVIVLSAGLFLLSFRFALTLSVLAALGLGLYWYYLRVQFRSPQ